MRKIIEGISLNLGQGAQILGVHENRGVSPIQDFFLWLI